MRRPTTVRLERMLGIHLLQHWFNLSDPAVDWITTCKFRHLLEAHNPGDQLFALINLRADQSAPGTVPVVAARSGVVGLEFSVDPDTRMHGKICYKFAWNPGYCRKI